jgi:hypothetical protein
MNEIRKMEKSLIVNKLTGKPYTLTLEKRYTKSKFTKLLKSLTDEELKIFTTALHSTKIRACFNCIDKSANDVGNIQEYSLKRELAERFGDYDNR